MSKEKPSFRFLFIDDSTLAKELDNDLDYQIRALHESSDLSCPIKHPQYQHWLNRLNVTKLNNGKARRQIKSFFQDKSPHYDMIFVSEKYAGMIPSSSKTPVTILDGFGVTKSTMIPELFSQINEKYIGAKDKKYAVAQAKKDLLPELEKEAQSAYK